MDNQYLIWKNEHTGKTDFLPGHAGTKVTEDVVYFINFLKSRDLFWRKRLKAIDIGAGKGRNSMYLLNIGIEVTAVDFIKEALDSLTDRAKQASINQKLIIEKMRIDENWKFKDNYFDIAIDSLSSIDISDKKGRINCRDEMFRTLKPGGFALFRCVSTNDPFEKTLMKNYPGTSNNSSIWPKTGKFQKNYDYRELRTFFNDFNFTEITEYTKKAVKMDKEFEAVNFRLILQKPEKWH